MLDRVALAVGGQGEDYRAAASSGLFYDLTPEKTVSPGRTGTPSAETLAMLFWALLASRQITMRKVDGWQTLAEPLAAVLPLAPSTWRLAGL